MRVAGLGLLGLAAGVAPAAAQTLHYEGGTSVTSGTYFFTERTTAWSVHGGLALRIGSVTIRGTLPLHGQDTRLLTGSGTGWLPTGGQQHAIVGDSSEARRRRGSGPGAGTVGRAGVTVPALAARAGGRVAVMPSPGGFQFEMGDPMLHLSATVAGGDRTTVTIGAGVKIPATDSAAFGTGKWDGGGSVGVSHRAGATVVLGLDLSYWWLGDLPELELRDPVSASASVSHLAGSSWGFSGSVSAARSIVAGFDPAISIGAAATRLGRTGLIGVNVSAGLTETAPDLSVALSWRVRLSARGT